MNSARINLFVAILVQLLVRNIDPYVEYYRVARWLAIQDVVGLQLNRELGECNR